MDQRYITTTYQVLLNAMQVHREASEYAIEAREILEVARLKAIRDGYIIGKNEDERKAKLHEILPVQIEDVVQAEAKEREAKFRLDCAQIAVEQMRAELRLEEISQRAAVVMVSDLKFVSAA
jgi:hypothetical protein